MTSPDPRHAASPRAPMAQAPNARGPAPWRRDLWLMVSLVLMIAGVDQWTKGWAVDRLGPLSKDRSGHVSPPPGKPPLEIWEGYLRLSITGNSGAIFGLGRDLSETFKRPFFALMSALAVLFVLLLVRSSHHNQRMRRLGLAAILAGALGNLIDRLGLDYVVDFIDWYGGYRWPTFNVADVAITAGVFLVLLDLWRHPDPLPPAPSPPPPTPEEPPARDAT